MARSYLTTKHEMWLCENFASKSNQELAVQLTEMVEKDNEKHISRLESVLKNVTEKNVIRSIEKELKWRKRFKGYSASYIKHAGIRMKCCKKSFEYLSSTNREKAHATNIKRWLKAARVVDNPSEWLSTFKCNEKRICQIHDNDELKKFRNAIFYFNRNNSEEFGFFFSSNYISEVNLLRVISVPLVYHGRFKE